MDPGGAGGNRVCSRGFERSDMRLFRRKAGSEHEGERCPRCRERVPRGADLCQMCGVDLRPFRGDALDEKSKAPVGTG
jgi:hypothetical protein